MKKNLNIVLIALVLALWGTVAYKHVYKYFVSEEIPVLYSDNKDNFNFNEIAKDTFVLEKIERDPFLNNKIHNNPVIIKNEIKTERIIIPKKIEIIKEPIICPPIQYFGYIKAKSKSDELILIKINDNLYKSRKNEIIEDVLLDKVFNDSIIIIFNKKKKVIHLNKYQ